MKKLLVLLVVMLPVLSYAGAGLSGIGNGSGVFDEDGSKKSLLIDSTKGAIVSIDLAHHEIHKGDNYFVEGSSTIPATGIVEFIMKTDAGESPHLTFDYASTQAEYTFVAYEGVTVSTTGATEVTPLNNNRNSSNTAATQVWVSSGTGTTSATVVYGPFTLGVGGNQVSRLGGSQTHDTEKDLKLNTWYVFRFTNGATEQVLNYRAEWYE